MHTEAVFVFDLDDRPRGFPKLALADAAMEITEQLDAAAQKAGAAVVPTLRHANISAIYLVTGELVNADSDALLHSTGVFDLDGLLLRLSECKRRGVIQSDPNNVVGVMTELLEAWNDSYWPRLPAWLEKILQRGRRP